MLQRSVFRNVPFCLQAVLEWLVSTTPTRADGLNVGETLAAGLRSTFTLTLHASVCVRALLMHERISVYSVNCGSHLQELHSMTAV